MSENSVNQNEGRDIILKSAGATVLGGVATGGTIAPLYGAYKGITWIFDDATKLGFLDTVTNSAAAGFENGFIYGSIATAVSLLAIKPDRVYPESDSDADIKSKFDLQFKKGLAAGVAPAVLLLCVAMFAGDDIEPNNPEPALHRSTILEN